MALELLANLNFCYFVFGSFMNTSAGIIGLCLVWSRYSDETCLVYFRPLKGINRKGIVQRAVVLLNNYDLLLDGIKLSIGGCT